jgi:Holliday junction resolvase RusA-like endonuclease
MTGVAFCVPGKPIGKGRARAYRKGNHIGHYTPEQTVAYEAKGAALAKLAMAGAEPFTGPVSVVIRAYLAIPKSFSRVEHQRAVLGRRRPTSKPDGDNMAKAACDFMNGIVYADDKQIAYLSVAKFYGEIPRVEIEVAAIDVDET